jgi:hypothetical protein
MKHGVRVINDELGIVVLKRAVGCSNAVSEDFPMGNDVYPVPSRGFP